MAEVQNIPQQSEEMPQIPPVKKPEEQPKGVLAEAQEKAKEKGPKKRNRVVQYFAEVRDELKKVEWPSRKDTIRGTLVVVGLSVFVAVILGASDILFGWILDRTLNLFK